MRKPTGPKVEYREDRSWWGVLEYVKGQRNWIASGLASRSQAEDALAAIIIERRRGRTPDPQVGELMGYYLDERVPHTLTADKALSFHRILTPYWATLPLSSVNKAACQNYAKRRLKEFKDLG